MFDTLINDIRYAARTLMARPGFSAAVVLTLALGIGANTLVFSLIDSIFLKPLPYREDAALIDLSNRYEKSGPQRAGVSIPDYLDRRAGVPALADIALYTNANLNLSAEGGPQRLQALRVTPSLFSTLGVGAKLGRTFTDEEARIGNEKVLVLGNALWRNGFNADPGIVGRDLRIDGENWRVVGVMPEGFMFPNRDSQVFVPFAFTDEQKGGSPARPGVFRQCRAPRARRRYGPGQGAMRRYHPTQRGANWRERYRWRGLSFIHRIVRVHRRRAALAIDDGWRSIRDPAVAAVRCRAGAAYCLREHRQSAADALSRRDARRSPCGRPSAPGARELRANC